MRWSIEKCIIEVKKHKSLKEWSERSSGSFQYIYKKGLKAKDFFNEHNINRVIINKTVNPNFFKNLILKINRGYLPLTPWLGAQAVYLLWIKNGMCSETKIATKIGWGKKYTSSYRTMIKAFKSGWVPEEDFYWRYFINQYPEPKS